MIKQYKLRFYNFRLVLLLIAISSIGVVLVTSARADLRTAAGWSDSWIGCYGGSVPHGLFLDP